MSDVIHIVCLDAPSPPNYGGAIDMYCKIKSLAFLGKKIILHYFDYREERHAEGLESYCIQIYKYKRKGFFTLRSMHLPFIIRSRNSRELAHQLNKDDFPILLEGLHCTGILKWLHPSRNVIVRLHNEEASYYKILAGSESNFFRKVYMRYEGWLLDMYYKRLPEKIKLAALSTADCDTIRHRYGFQTIHFIPCFLPWQKLTSLEGNGNFCLYHGNMQVSENVDAALWLIHKVFSKIAVTFIVAGKSIPRKLLELEHKFKNVRMINNPGMDDIQKLIKTAQINILPSYNKTGVKLKLLHAMYEGRFCITNNNGLQGTAIREGIHVANEASEFIKTIEKLFTIPFTTDEITKRNNLLVTYNNNRNASLLNELW